MKKKKPLLRKQFNALLAVRSDGNVVIATKGKLHFDGGEPACEECIDMGLEALCIVRREPKTYIDNAGDSAITICSTQAKKIFGRALKPGTGLKVVITVQERK